MARLRQLISEVHRRSIWQVLGIYLLASWVVFEVMQTMTEGLGLPEWFPALAVVLLLVGLPIVLATAFGQAYERLEEYDEARKAYAYFVSAWKDADPELQPRVEAAQRAMSALSPDQ